MKKMRIKEFVEEGYLQEANRRFFHPLGLALEVTELDNGEFRLSGIWDYREDEEGIMFFVDDLNTATALMKASTVYKEFQKHAPARIKLFGDPVQPMGEGEIVDD